MRPQNKRRFRPGLRIRRLWLRMLRWLPLRRSRRRSRRQRWSRQGKPISLPNLRKSIHTNSLKQATGGFWFLTSLLLWYLLLIQLLAITGYEIQLPVGDLTRIAAARSKQAPVQMEKTV